MTTLRSECRATLAWCLDQPENFTQRDCYEHFGIHQVAISKNFCRLERLGVLKRAHVYGRQYMFYIINRPFAEQLAEERPKPKNGYIPVSQRSNRAIGQSQVKAAQTPKWQGVNSIFAMRAL